MPCGNERIGHPAEDPAVKEPRPQDPAPPAVKKPERKPEPAYAEYYYRQKMWEDLMARLRLPDIMAGNE